MVVKDKDELDELVRRHTPLVRSIASRFTGRGVDMDDLFQLGAIGLIKAIEGFDEDYGTCFSTYAVPKIMGEIKRFLRDDGTVKVSRSIKEKAYTIEQARRRLLAEKGEEPRISEIALEVGLTPEETASCINASSSVASLDEPLTEDGGTLLDIKGDNSTAEEKMIEHMSLYEAINRLGDEERKVLALRFFRDMTQQKTADLLGMTQVKVSRIEKKAIQRLRTLMA